MAYGLIGGFVISPADYQQGEGYRILYVHAPTAWMSLQVYVVMAVASAVALIWRIKVAHAVAAACGKHGRHVYRLRARYGLALGRPDVGHVLGVGSAHHLRAGAAARAVSGLHRPARGHR